MTKSAFITARFRQGIQAIALSSAALALATGLLATPAHAQSNAGNLKELRIGYQKYGTLVILKARGTLDKRLADKGIAVKWSEFPFGPPLLEAINVGSIDVGTVGESPPVFAQAAGADLVYVGNEPPAPGAEALLVPKDSPIRSVAELKGKKIAVAKGFNANYLLVKLLENAGLKYSDVEVVYLAPADARAAFESGRVAAWSIWDPFLAAAEKQLSARVLADGRGAVANHQFYLAARAFAEKHPSLPAPSPRSTRKSSISCLRNSTRSTSGASRIRRKSPSSWRRRSASSSPSSKLLRCVTAMASSRSQPKCWRRSRRSPTSSSS